jgi:hypothetical protein
LPGVRERVVRADDDGQGPAASGIAVIRRTHRAACRT